MPKVSVAGLNIDSITKADFLHQLLLRIKQNQKTFVITPYSEFLFHALKNPGLMQVYNRADFSLADGIGIFWAKKYLELPLTAKTYVGKILQSWWQLKYSLAAIIFYPRWIKSALPEKIVGADLVWNLAKMAAENNLSIFIFGGEGDVPELAAKKLLAKYSNLKIAGTSNKLLNDPGLDEEIIKASPDLLLAGLKAVDQELWLASKIEKLPAKVFIGLGGTFDYLAGKRANPPKFMRYAGLEWLYRLITQPFRYKRIINATWGLGIGLLRYKVFNSYPLRPNAAVVLLNSENQVMICRRNPADFRVDMTGEATQGERENYWQFPQGGIDRNEDIVQAAARELMEETNITQVKHLYTSARKNIYYWSNAGRHLWINRNFLFKGQEQSIVYFRFIGKDEEIKFPEDDELMEHRWVEASDLDKVAAKERFNLVRLAQEDLKEMQEKGIINIEKIDQK
ncbi:MAG: WecB/TagA/CpsF family glycosyltransferase [Candidatus Doudnabacteria bacterium]|nr:WecB/TagA/CpsF family glycosyltransferase [Candidatus Doudnabacteria bacterium]